MVEREERLAQWDFRFRENDVLEGPGVVLAERARAPFRSNGLGIMAQRREKSAESLDLVMMLVYSLSMPINSVDNIDNLPGGMLS
jgi:hypothetical protein